MNKILLDILQTRNGSDETKSWMFKQIKSTIWYEGMVCLVTKGGAVGGHLETRVRNVKINVHCQLDPIVTPCPSLCSYRGRPQSDSSKQADDGLGWEVNLG